MPVPAGPLAHVAAPRLGTPPQRQVPGKAKSLNQVAVDEGLVGDPFANAEDDDDQDYGGSDGDGGKDGSPVAAHPGGTPLSVLEQQAAFIECFKEELVSQRPLLLSQLNNLYKMRSGEELLHKMSGYERLRDFLLDIPGLCLIGRGNRMQVRLGDSLKLEAFQNNLRKAQAEASAGPEGGPRTPQFRMPKPLPQPLLQSLYELFANSEDQEIPLRNFLNVWNSSFPTWRLDYRSLGFKDVRGLLSQVPFIEKVGGKSDAKYVLRHQDGGRPGEQTMQGMVDPLSIALLSPGPPGIVNLGATSPVACASMVQALPNSVGSNMKVAPMVARQLVPVGPGVDTPTAGHGLSMFPSSPQAQLHNSWLPGPQPGRLGGSPLNAGLRGTGGQTNSYEYAGLNTETALTHHAACGSTGVSALSTTPTGLRVPAGQSPDRGARPVQLPGAPMAMDQLRVGDLTGYRHEADLGQHGCAGAAGAGSGTPSAGSWRGVPATPPGGLGPGPAAASNPNPHGAIGGPVGPSSPGGRGPGGRMPMGHPSGECSAFAAPPAVALHGGDAHWGSRNDGRRSFGSPTNAVPYDPVVGSGQPMAAALSHGPEVDGARLRGTPLDFGRAAAAGSAGAAAGTGVVCLDGRHASTAPPAPPPRHPAPTIFGDSRPPEKETPVNGAREPVRLSPMPVAIECLETQEDISQPGVSQRPVQVRLVPPALESPLSAQHEEEPLDSNPEAKPEGSDEMPRRVGPDGRRRGRTKKAMATFVSAPGGLSSETRDARLHQGRFDMCSMLQMQLREDTASLVCDISSGQVVVTNQQCEDLFESSEDHESVVGADIFTLVHESDRDQFSTTMAYLMVSERPRMDPQELRIVTLPGQTRLVRAEGMRLIGMWWQLDLWRQPEPSAPPPPPPVEAPPQARIPPPPLESPMAAPAEEVPALSSVPESAQGSSAMPEEVPDVEQEDTATPSWQERRRNRTRHTKAEAWVSSPGAFSSETRDARLHQGKFDMFSILRMQLREDAPCAVCDIDTGQVVVANVECEELFEASHEKKLVHTDMFSLVHPNDRDGFASILAYLMVSERERMEAQEIGITTLSGNSRTVSCEGTHVMGMLWRLDFRWLREREGAGSAETPFHQ